MESEDISAMKGVRAQCGGLIVVYHDDGDRGGLGRREVPHQTLQMDVATL